MKRLITFLCIQVSIALGILGAVTETFDDESVFPAFGLGGITATQHTGAFGEWTLYDGNGMKVYGLTDVEYENKYAPSAWMVFNRAKTNPVHGDGKSHSGHQCMMSVSSIEDHVPATTDHWLISPELSGEAQTITFYARQLTTQYGNEKYEVLASSTNNTPTSFTIVGSTREITGEDWQEVSVSLPAGSKYFAIRHISYDIFAMLVDDITYEPKGSTGSGLAINETNFPDEVFRNWLKAQSYGVDGIITATEINVITSISVNAMDIKSLNGIEYFSAMTELRCYGNQLTSLDVSKNSLLSILICDMNKLTSLDVTKNTELTELTCQGNKLTSLDVTKNTVLKKLFCEYNNLTNIDVSNNPALTKLYCNNNQLTTLNLSKNIALEDLYCYCNQIQGAGMDALLASLSSGSVKMRAIYNKNENNVMTKAQVAAAKAKGATPLYYDGTEWKEYAGSDDDPSGDGGSFFYYQNEDGTLTITHAGERWHGQEGNQHWGTCCSYAGDIVIPEEIDGKTVTAVGKAAFWRSDITSLKLPKTLKLIADEAFLECRYVKDLAIPASVDSIGRGAFNSWDALESVTIEDSPNVLHTGSGGYSVMSSIFSDQPLLKKAYVGRNHKSPLYGSMGYEVNLFAHSHLQEITYGDYVTEIQQHELIECNSLKKVNLGKNITSIGALAFSGCDLISSIDLPAILTSIGEETFVWCPIETIRIPASVSTIEKNAFRNTAMKNIYCYGTIPAVCNGWIFEGISKNNMTLHYPQGTRDAYKAAECWKEFFDDHAVEFDASGINAITIDDVQNCKVYNLKGQQVDSQTTQKGLYILNGKKIIRK